MTSESNGVLLSQAADEVVEVGNQLAERNPRADPWEIAAGLLGGAVQFWLFTHQPCDKAECEECAEIATSALRLERLLDEVREFAQTSEYFHSPHDSDVGRA